MIDQKTIDRRAEEMADILREAREECLFKTGYSYGFDDALKEIIECCKALLEEE